MRRKSKQPKTGLQLLFEERTTSIYNGMRGRFCPKYRGEELIRAGRPMPFSLEVFRAWVFKQFGHWDQPCKCAYCNAWVTVGDFVVDHIIPASPPWWGSIGLENLCIACKVCNGRKGKCSADGFRKLIDFLLTLDTRDMNDILGRLATGGEGMKVLWKRKSQPALAAPKGGLF